MTKLTREQLDDPYKWALTRAHKTGITVEVSAEVFLQLIAMARRALDLEERDDRIKNACVACSGTGRSSVDTPFGPHHEHCTGCDGTGDSRKRKR